MIFDAQAKSLVAPPWEGYRFVRSPKKWDRSCHKYPCSQTDLLDRLLNLLVEDSVLLDDQELAFCRKWGALRDRASRGHNNFKVSTRSDLQVNIEGVIGEKALAKLLGIPFEPTINTYRKADLPGNIEVRARTVLWYDLKVRPDDDDQRKVVMGMITDNEHTVRFPGWMYAKEGKQFPLIDPNHAGQPFHAVPQDRLRSMKELREILKSERVI